MTFPLRAYRDSPRKPWPWWVPAALGFGGGLGVFLVGLPLARRAPSRPTPAPQTVAPPPAAPRPPVPSPALTSAQPEPATLRDLPELTNGDRLYVAGALAKAFCMDQEGNKAAAPALALALQSRGLLPSIVTSPSIQELAKPMVRGLCPGAASAL